MCRWLTASAVMIALCAQHAEAHTFAKTQVLAVIKQDGTFLVDMRVDVDALALGVSSGVPSAEVAAALRALPPDEFDQAVERARNTLIHRVRIRFDDEKVAFSVSFPRHEQGESAEGMVKEPTVLGTTARLYGRVPQNAETFTFGASRAFNLVQLTILDEVTAAGTKHVLAPGANCPPYRIHEIEVPSGGTVLARYLVLGYQHILPKGQDHILFVFGLFLLSARMRPLMWQITAFTVAHSVTLALSMADIASLPPRVVEPLIALSIAYIGVENIFVDKLKPWRPVVVFCFGLLHGMGFAGVLRELGMPDGRFGVALVGFNLGVEFGQLSVVAAAFLVLGWFRNRSWYRNAVIRPLSLAIALIGAVWTVQRFLAG